MSELDRILLTSSLTIIVGLTLLVLGKIVEIFWIEPVKSYRKIVGEIEYCLYNYSNFFMNPGTGDGSELRRVSNELRDRASNLRGNSFSLPKWKWVRKIFSIPRDIDLNKAASCLVGISNRLFCPNEHLVFSYIDLNEKASDVCRKYLDIKSLQ